MKFKLWLENFNYPTIKWIKSTLKNSCYAPTNVKILAAYIVGSEAKGTAKLDSDLDIAVVIMPIRGKTSIQKSSEYHNKFRCDSQKPRWNGRMIDFQFFTQMTLN